MSDSLQDVTRRYLRGEIDGDEYTAAVRAHVERTDDAYAKMWRDFSRRQRRERWLGWAIRPVKRLWIRWQVFVIRLREDRRAAPWES